MTLEDFFTLTKMKDGLTTPARVEELISILKKEKDSLVKNISDPTKQWASVASLIIATDNKECLDLFVNLDGLSFLDEWLKFAQTCPKNEGDTFVDEVISLLLQAVEKLDIDNKRLITSGIYVTVENLLSYSSDKVKDRARTLYDSWKVKDVDLIDMDPTLNNEHSDTRVAVNNTSPFQSVDDNHRCNSREPLDYKASPVKMDSVESNNEASCEVLISEGVVVNGSQCEKIGSVCDELGEVGVSFALESVDILSNDDATLVKEGKNDGVDVKIIPSDDANVVVGVLRDEIDGNGSTEPNDLDRSEAKKGRKSKKKYFGFARLTKSSKNNDNIINGTNMDLEDRTVDALEVACFLAKQVEREVMGYDDQSGTSSSDETTSRKNSNGRPESINGDDPEMNNVINGLSGIQHTNDRTNENSKLEIQVQDMESSSQVTDSFREREVDTERNVCEFDLNREIEKDHSDGGISSSLDQKRGFLDIDLNVAEDERSEKVEIDLNLNQIGEDGGYVTPCVLKIDENILGFQNTEIDEKILGFQNTPRGSPSPASSSSCLQPSMRNFDLNDNPSHSSNNLPHHHPFMSESSSHKMGSYVGPPDDSVISILGVKVKANAVLPQTMPFSNERVSEPIMDACSLRGGSFFGLGHAHPYGYNGLHMGPLVSFPPGLTYGTGGPAHYMFDSRGSPVMPQILGSVAPTGPTPSCGQPSFVMNLMGSSQTVPNLDLNMGFERFLGPGRVGPLQEQLRDRFGPLGSGPGTGKRKEPDNGWDLYAGNSKHHQPPHL